MDYHEGFKVRRGVTGVRWSLHRVSGARAEAGQLYRERLQRGEIALRRTANDAVELHIKNVQPSDEGHYKCSTPSTDATVQGNYEDTVQVKGNILMGLITSGARLFSATRLCQDTELPCDSAPSSV